MRTLAGILLALAFVSTPAAAQVVVLDPGHGGHDPGAVGCGLEEEDVVLDVSLRAATLLREAGLTVHLTRSDDRFIELAARSSFANSLGASRFVSVHANSNAGTPATGTETFVYTSASSTSRSLGQTVQDDLIDTWGLRDRGLKTANFSVIRRTSMPAALAELGFINRCDIDAGFLGSTSERGRIATALARSILTSLGLSGPSTPAPPVEPPVAPPVEPPSSSTGRIIGVAFEDIGVGLEDTSRRIAGATVRVNGETQSSGGDGLFQFNFVPGTYRIEVSKDGFASATRDCVVRAGSDAWCSVGLSPASAGLTRVRGVIYEENGSGPTSAPRLAGAIVDYGGMRVTTDASGNFDFEVAPGSLTLNVSKEGYSPAARACTASGSETWCSVGLTSAASAGTMQGVVYVDGQINNRIEGATVRIRESGASILSASRSGYWRLELPAGTYTLDIDAAGFESKSETCVVREGGQTWCSVGLVSNGGGAFVIDDRQPEEAALDAHDPSAINGGCSASGAGASNLWLLGLFGMMFFRRRRQSAALTAVLAVGAGLSGCSETPDVAAASQALQEAARPTDSEILLAQEVSSFARLENATQVGAGDFVDLELSPNGQHLALSHARYGALSVLNVETREVRVIHEGPQAGYEPRWRDDSEALGVRTEGQTSTAAPTLAFGVDGKVDVPFQPSRALLVRVDQGEIVMRTPDGDETWLNPPGDRYFEPRASADGEFVTFRGLSTGLYVHRLADGSTFSIGTGSHARFDAEGQYMVFERSIEDGHERTASSLFVLDLKSRELRYGLIETSVVRPDAPSIGNGRLAFMDEGSALIGELRFDR